MGRKPAVDAATGQRRIKIYAWLGSQAAAARAVSVSQSAASCFFRSLPKVLAPFVAQQPPIVTAAAVLLGQPNTCSQRTKPTSRADAGEYRTPEQYLAAV
jgi:hypothetical protein